MCSCKVKLEGLGLAQVRCSEQGTCSYTVMQTLQKSHSLSLASQTPELMHRHMRDGAMGNKPDVGGESGRPPSGHNTFPSGRMNRTFPHWVGNPERNPIHKVRDTGAYDIFTEPHAQLRKVREKRDRMRSRAGGFHHEHEGQGGRGWGAVTC